MTLDCLVNKEALDRGRFERMRRIAERKVRLKFWEEHNKLIDNAITRKADEGLPITRNAYNLMNVTIDIYSSLLKQARVGSQEFSFYLTGNKGSGLIDDIYIGRNQVVTPIRTISDEPERSAKPEGISSLRDIIKTQGKSIIAHGHSHGDLHSFFSGTDEETFYKLNQDRGKTIPLKVQHDDHHHEYSVRSFPALVVNHAHDIVIKEKTLRPTYSLDHQGNVTITKRYEDHDLSFKIIGEDAPVTREERQRIEHDLRTRITIDKKRKTLDQLLGTRTFTGHQPEEKDGMLARLKDRYRQLLPAAEKQVRPVVMQKNIEEKVLVEDAYHQGLKKEYERLLRENQSLQRENAYLFTKPVSTSYTKNMHDYAKKLQRSREMPERLLGTMAKVLSGNYRGSLDHVLQGNYQEDRTKTRIRAWDDRLQAAMRLYADNKESIDTVNTGYLDSLKEMLHKNYYFRKHHGEKLDELERLFLNIKRKNVYAPPASCRTPCTASTADNPALATS